MDNILSILVMPSQWRICHAVSSSILLVTGTWTHVRQKRLEAHVFDSGNVLGTLEVLAGTVFTTFSCVVNEVFGDFAECTTFLTEIDYDAAATLLGLLHGIFDTEGKVWTARADVRSEDIATIAFIVDTKCEAGFGV